MRYNLNHQKPLPGYKTPNPNFPKQLYAFLLQSKHQKHEQFQDIDQYLVEQFLHLFEIWNINRFIDYTKEFINQVRSVILRLEVVEKKTFECLKEEFICLIYEGKIQRIQKENLCKRTSKCAFQSNALMGHFNSRSSHQTLHNIQLKEFEKSIIMDRSQRMSITNGNLWNEMISLPKRKTKLEEKTSIQHGLIFSDQNHSKKQEQFLHLTQVNSSFQQKIKEEQTMKDGNSYTELNEISPIQKYSNQYGMELIQTLQDEIYQCMTPVKCIKVLKWSYDHLVQYVYKYQTDRLIEFLSAHLYISEHDIKFHQVYNKIGFHFYPKRQSQHSNLYIGLDEGALYVLRKGAVELKYQCRPTSGKGESNSSKLITESRSNPNLAQYVNRPETKYQKVILNEGAIICPELENYSFFIQSLEEVVLLEIDHNLLEVLKSQLKDNWWNEKLKSSYEKVKVDRKLYMKDEQIRQKQEFRELKMNNVSIESKSKILRSNNKQKSRFRAQTKKLNENQNQNFIIQQQETQVNSQDKENNESDFNPEEYKQFISFLPYEIMIKSKEKISMKLKEKSKIKNVSSKVFNYLKKNQKVLSSTKSKERVLALKMKNIASKQINLKDLESLQDEINNNEAKKEFHRSLKGNWFKEEIDFSSDPTVNENSPHRKSATQMKMRKHALLDQKKAGRYRSSIQIGVLANKIDRLNKRLTADVIQTKAVQSDEKKVTCKVQDQSSDEEYLCKDDTGLINKFIQNSHNYQKQLSYLITASQLEETQLKHKRRLKKHKTDGIVFGYSQHLLRDMKKRASCQNKKSIVSTPSNKENQKILDLQSKSDSFDENKVFKNENYRNKNLRNLRNGAGKNYEDFSTLLTGMVGKKVEIHDSSEFFAGWNEGKELKNGKQSHHISIQNLSFVRKSRDKAFQPSRKKCNNHHSSLENRRGSLNLRKQPCMENEFVKGKVQRPMSGQPHIETVHQECRSLFFNQWIDSSSEIESEKLQNSDLAVAKYNFCDRNTSTGDQKIWRKLKSGKIVKKSVRYYSKNCKVNSCDQTVNNNTAIV